MGTRDAAISDSQVVEITRRNWLLTELYRSGVEVARPEHDDGIYLIAFFDLDESKRFIARPIQMKASSQRMFGVWRRLERFPDLLELIEFLNGAGDRFRTDDLVLGKHTLYQLSYTRPQALSSRGRIDRFIRPGAACQI